MKKIAIIGASYLQVPLILKAKEIGLETHVFAWLDGSIGRKYADFFYNLSIIEKDKILNECVKLNISGITTVGSDVAVETVNYIADYMNLAGNSTFTTKYTRDKLLMRQLFEENKLPTVKFYKLEPDSDLTSLKLNFPIMIKATDRSGSRGINYVATPNTDKIKLAFEESLNESFTNSVIAEEFFDGKQISVEMISQNGIHHFVGITEEFYSGIPNFVEIGHIVPAKISNELLEDIIILTKKILSVVKIENGASHTEIRINDNNEFCIIEVASRMGGDFRDLMILNSYQYDYLKNTLKVALGENIDIPKNNTNSGYSFIKWILNQNDLIKVLKFENLVKIIQKDIPEITKITAKEIKDSSNRFGYILAMSDEYPQEYIL